MQQIRPRDRFNAPSPQSLDKGRNIAQAMARRATHRHVMMPPEQPRNSAFQNPGGSRQSRQKQTESEDPSCPMISSKTRSTE